MVQRKKMECLIKQQVFALDMESLSSQMERLHLQRREVILLYQLWDNLCDETIPRRLVEFTWEQGGMECTIAELRVPTFYFRNEKKFWYQLNCILKSRIQAEYWLKSVILQTFVNEWCNESFIPKSFKEQYAKR